jgi:hypothetical protein
MPCGRRSSIVFREALATKLTVKHEAKGRKVPPNIVSDYYVAFAGAQIALTQADGLALQVIVARHKLSCSTVVVQDQLLCGAQNA